MVQSRSVSEVRAALERTDWDFPRSGTQKDSVHSIHWFPGNFIPQIPSFLIQLLSDVGDHVLDPFCGSGTTLVEAALLGRIGIGGDTNRAALQVARAKIAILEESDRVAASIGYADNILTWASLVAADDIGDQGEGASEELTQWFHCETLRQLRGIWKKIVEPTSGPDRWVLEALFTDTLFACASSGRSLTRTGGIRRHHWGWVADNVIPPTTSFHDAVALYAGKLHRIRRVLSSAGRVRAESMSVFAADARFTTVRDGKYQLVVTSPPYLGMIDYSRANRLTYLWHGWSVAASQQVEIGARYRRSRSDCLAQYSMDMTRSADQVVRALRPGGYCAVVVGASRRYPEARDTVIDAFKERLELIWGPTLRRPTRRRLSERQGREVEEVVCVLRA